MSILRKIKDEISKAGQHALGIDGVRFKLDVTLQKLDVTLEKLDVTLHKLNRLDWIEGELTRSNEQIQSLKSFLAWYSNRVEPWFWSGNFSHTDPEEELAGLLFNFLPGRVLVDVAAKPDHFAKAATAIGYNVVSVEPANPSTSLAVSQSLPLEVDFLKVARENLDLELVKSLEKLNPAVVQTGFVYSESQPSGPVNGQNAPLSETELISEMRNREYYWNVMIFRTEAEGFIRLATNLASVPSQAWGSQLFFRDHQLFLKAFHWCKTTLPRFRAAPLAR
jgi:hypothetical protein